MQTVIFRSKHIRAGAERKDENRQTRLRKGLLQVARSGLVEGGKHRMCDVLYAVVCVRWIIIIQ